MSVSNEKFNLKRSHQRFRGRMTVLGVSKVSEAVLEAQRFGGTHF